MDTDLDHVGGCMANYSKFIKLLLSFVIAISPIVLINNANAASLGGWTLGGGVAEGASTVYNGTKNVIINGADYIKKGTAKITPNAAQVAKVLRRGAAGYALSIAVEQLLGSVDWVLDPANNQIKYYLPTDCSLNSNSCEYIWRINPNSVTQAYFSAESGLRKQCDDWYGSGNYNLQKINYSNDGKTASVYCKPEAGSAVVYRVLNPAYDQTKPEELTIPLDVVAQKVISNAASGDAAAQVATTAAAADIVAEAETDSTKARPITKQLEANAETATDETATGESVPKDPTAPDATKPTNISLEFPKFCGWAPSVCEAAQVVISFPTLVTEWWESANNKADGWASSISQSWAAAKEWATSEPSQDNTQVDVENNNTQEIDTQVSFSSQCPANIKLADFSYHGISQSWDVDFSKFCDVFATYLRPVVISIGAFSAVLIVSGVGVRENG